MRRIFLDKFVAVKYENATQAIEELKQLTRKEAA